VVVGGLDTTSNNLAGEPYVRREMDTVRLINYDDSQTLDLWPDSTKSHRNHRSHRKSPRKVGSAAHLRTSGESRPRSCRILTSEYTAPSRRAGLLKGRRLNRQSHATRSLNQDWA
jgi:hypothetical protein